MIRKLFYILIIIGNISFDCLAQYNQVESNGVEIYYRVFGKGEPLLILGGGPGDNANRYLSLCELLSKSFQCILVDQRGTGKSMPAVLDSTTISIELTLSDFEALRKELNLESWTVLGFSYGGYLASLYAHFYPNAVSSLILLGSIGLNLSIFQYFNDNITSRLSNEGIEKFDYWNDSARVAADPHHTLVERIRARIPGYFYDRKKSLIVSQNMQDSDFNFELGKWIWGDIQRKDLNLEKVESRFNKPVLILHGRQDPVGESIPQKLSTYYKHAQLFFLEKCGHYSWVEQPEKVYRYVKEFLGK
ncbi:MAG: alpha/beta hydrolase [Bacteroidota bacterium]